MCCNAQTARNIRLFTGAKAVLQPLTPIRRNFYKEIRKGVITIVQVIVRDNNVDQALRALKKKMQREGLFREMKLRRHYEKPSVKKARERSEAVRRHRKLERKRKERDGE